MEKQDFIKALRTLGRTVAYYPIFSRIFQNSNCGVFISQMLYWEGKQEDEDGWIRKPLQDIEEELYFTRYEMETIRKRLKEAGVLEESRRGMPAKLHFKFNWAKVNDLIYEYQLRPAQQQPKEEEKQPNIIYRMKEYFLVKYSDYVKEAEYAWMEKDWAHMKLLKALFEKRVTSKKQKINPENIEPPTDDEIFDLFKKFIDVLPEWHRTQRYTPAFLYTDFNSIEQKVIAEQKPKKTNVNNGKTDNIFEAAIQAAQ